MQLSAELSCAFFMVRVPGNVTLVAELNCPQGKGYLGPKRAKLKNKRKENQAVNCFPNKI